jgi:hypothetical protein
MVGFLLLLIQQIASATAMIFRGELTYLYYTRHIIFTVQPDQKFFAKF